MKRCTKCGYEKQTEAFSPKKTQCKECRAEDRRSYIATNPERVRQLKAEEYARNHARRYAENPNKYRAKAKAYRTKSREQVLISQRAAHAKNKDKENARSRTWKEANKSQMQKTSLTYRTSIGDHYVRTLLSAGTSLPGSAFPQEMVSLKREQIYLHRLTKQLKQAINEQEET